MSPTPEITAAKLEQLLICPVCHSELNINELRQQGEGKCYTCKYRFSFKNGVYDFTPIPPPDNDVSHVWHTWEELQRNGNLSYELDPEHNLSVGVRDDVSAFAAFCRLSGLTLDIGCGPQRQIPSYATDAGGYIGVDPLRGVQQRDFMFIQAIAEYLPFRSASFDHVVYATSLDHLLSAKRSLAESKRVLKSNGIVNIWFFDTMKRPSALSILRARIRFAFSLLGQGRFIEFGQRVIRRPISTQPSISPVAQSPTYLADMTIPSGAIDHFHFVHPSQNDVVQWLHEVGLTVTKTRVYQTNHVFMQARAAK